MALRKQEWRKRVAAAAALHGMDLRDLEDLGPGLPRGAARRAGHDSDDYPPNHALALVLAERLELPIGWFEDEDWRPLVSINYSLPPQAEVGLRRQEQQIEMLQETVTRLRLVEEHLERLVEGLDLRSLEVDEAAAVLPPEARPERSEERPGAGESSSATP